MKLKVANGSAELQVSDAAFGHAYNPALVFQVVNAYRAAGRAGNLSRFRPTRAGPSDQQYGTADCPE